MANQQDTESQVKAIARPAPGGFVQWLQDPMGQIIASSVAVIGSFGVVLSGTWFIHMALN